MENLGNLRQVSGFEVLEKAREKGLVIGGAIMNSQGFIKLCHSYGVYPKEVLRFLQPF